MAKKSEKQATKKDLRDFRITDLLVIKRILIALRDNSEWGIKDAVNSLHSSDANLSRSIKQCEREFRDSIGIQIGASYLESVGGKWSVTDNTRPTLNKILEALEEIHRQINELTEIGAPGKIRQSVRFATILSVVNYIGPALLAVLQGREQDCRENKYLSPNIEIEYGEIDTHIKLLEGGKVDFAINHDVDMSLAKSIGKVPLKIKPDERGLVFRYCWETKNTEYVFPSLISALRSSNPKALWNALEMTRMFTLSRYASSQHEPAFYQAHSRLISPLSTNLVGQVVTLPTFRSCRQMIQMGLGVGFSHCPTGKFRARIQHGLRFNARIGTDPEFPNVPLVFLPLSSLGLDPIEDVPFAVYFRKKDISLPFNKPNNCDMSVAALEVLNTINDIVEGQHGDFGYLKFSETHLLHNFHFCGAETCRYDTKGSSVPQARVFFTQKSKP